jgi:hypothetical protein
VRLIALPPSSPERSADAGSMGSGIDALLYEYLKDYMRAREASPWERLCVHETAQCGCNHSRRWVLISDVTIWQLT